MTYSHPTTIFSTKNDFQIIRKPCQPVIPNGPARLFLFSVSLRIIVNAFVFIFFPNHFPEIFYRPLAMANRLRPGQPFDHMQPFRVALIRQRKSPSCGYICRHYDSAACRCARPLYLTRRKLNDYNAGQIPFSLL